MTRRGLTDARARLSLSKPGVSNRLILLQWVAILAMACSSSPATSAPAVQAPPLPAVVNAVQDPALLTGQWIARLENGQSGAHAIRVLEITPSGEFTLKIAPEENGTSVASNGRWDFASAGRRIVSGAYTLTGPDSFRTSGGVTAAWTRIPADRKAARVEHAILSGMLLRTTMGASAVQNGAVDPGIVGVWEGPGEKDGTPVELVMSIYPNGSTGLVSVATYRGKLDHDKNGVTLTATAPAYRAIASDYRNGSFETTDANGAVSWMRKPPPNPRIEPSNYGDPRRAPRNRFGK